MPNKSNEIIEKMMKWCEKFQSSESLRSLTLSEKIRKQMFNEGHSIMIMAIQRIRQIEKEKIEMKIIGFEEHV